MKLNEIEILATTEKEVVLIQDEQHIYLTYDQINITISELQQLKIEIEESNE